MIMIVFLLEICMFIPIWNIRAKENKCSGYVCGYVCRVDEYTKKKFFKKRQMYVPTVNFEVGGKEYNVKYGSSDNKNEYTKGDQFWVMYNPADPLEIFQDDYFGRLCAKMLSFIGGGLIIFTLYLNFLN